MSCVGLFVFFFKQKTAYEMRISDWSSDVCSSDLFAQLLADVISGLVGVFAFFAIAFVITLVLLYLYTRSVRLTLVALVVALLPVLWLVGILPLIGFGIDPMSILVPFLIFSIGVSHAVQMTNAWRAEVVRGSTAEIGRAACRERVCQNVEISGVDVSLKKK